MLARVGIDQRGQSSRLADAGRTPSNEPAAQSPGGRVESEKVCPANRLMEPITRPPNGRHRLARLVTAPLASLPSLETFRKVKARPPLPPNSPPVPISATLP